jgi:hypothetical protein
MATEITEKEFKQILREEAWGVIKQEAKKLTLLDWLFLLFATLPLMCFAAPFYGAGLVSAGIIKFHAWLANKMPQRKQPENENAQV